MQPDPAVLDQVFWALSDSTRRGVMERLAPLWPESVSELAQPHGMSLPGFMKHLRVLEDAGLVDPARRKGGWCAANWRPKPMQEAAMWLSRYEMFWSSAARLAWPFLYHRGWRSPHGPELHTIQAQPRRHSPVPALRPGKSGGHR